VETTFDYIWTCDCQGLESIVEFNPKIIYAIKMRQQANQHRFCTFGTVTLSEKLFKYIDEICKQDRQKAWLLLGGTKEERSLIIAEMVVDNIDQKIIDMLMGDFTFRLGNASKKNIKIINDYSRMFKDEFIQQL